MYTYVYTYFSNHMKIRDFYPPLKSNLHPLIMQQGLKTLHPSQHITQTPRFSPAFWRNSLSAVKPPLNGSATKIPMIPPTGSVFLPGGFIPFEKYARQIGSSPQVGVKIKNIWNHLVFIAVVAVEWWISNSKKSEKTQFFHIPKT